MVKGIAMESPEPGNRKPTARRKWRHDRMLKKKVWKDMRVTRSACKNTPVATIVGVSISFLGELLGIINICQLPSLFDYFREHIVNVKAFKSFPVSILVICLTHTILVLHLVFILLVTCAGAKETEVTWKRKMGGKVPYLVMLILTFVALLFWGTDDSYTVYLTTMETVGSFYVSITSTYSTDRTHCNDYYANKNYSSCIQISFLKNVDDKSKICGKALVDKFCHDFLDKLGDLFVTFYFYDSLVYLGLMICLVCLVLNFSIARFESQINPEEVCNRRY